MGGKRQKNRQNISLGKDDSLPTPRWLSRMALRYVTRVSTCAAISECLTEVSHDCLTRMRNGSWSGHTLLALVLRTLFTVAGNSLRCEDTVVAKPYAQLLDEAVWVWSNKEQKVVFGVGLVRLVWTDGHSRMPVGYCVWHTDGPSKVDLGLELLSHACNRLKDSGGDFVCQCTKQRTLNGVALHVYRQHPYWHAVGYLSGGFKGRMVRHRRKYDVPNRLTLTAKEVRAQYRKRPEVEEVIRVLKSQRSLEACQVGYRRRGAETVQPQSRAQEHHIALCLVAYLMVERERLDQGRTWRQCKQQLILHGTQVALPVLVRVREAA